MLKEYLSNLAFHSYNIVRLAITIGNLSDFTSLPSGHKMLCTTFEQMQYYLPRPMNKL